MKKIILLIIMFITAFGYNNTNFPASELKNENFQNKSAYVDQFKINLNAKSVYQGFNAFKRYRSLMNLTFNPHILFKPLIKPLSSIDIIYIHPRFISTILFPETIKIISAYTSEKMNFLQYSDNLLMIKPTADDGIGNLIITAYDKKNRKNKLFNFIIKPFFPKNIMLDTAYGYYTAPNGAFLSLTVKYVENINLTPIKALNKIINLLGSKKFNRIFSKNGSIFAVIINHIPVYIKRDDKQGNIYAFKKKFIVKIGTLR